MTTSSPEIDPSPSAMVIESVPRRSPWLIIGGLIAAGIVAVVAISTMAWFGGLVGSRTDRSTDEFEGSISRIVVNDDVGDVRITAADRQGVRVNRKVVRAVRQPREEIAQSGQLLTIDASCENSGFVGVNCYISYDIEVPVNAKVQITTGTGDIEVVGSVVDANLASDTGDIRLSRATGMVSARTSNGDIRLEDIDATRIDATADTGDVSITAAGTLDQIKASSSNGNVDIQAASAFTALMGKSDTGDVTITATLRFTSITADSSSGNVAVMVGDPGPFQVTATSSSGDRTVRVPTVPDGAPSIKVSTDTGDVTVSNQ